MEQVLIVGAGPSGLTLAATLASYGMRLRIIDRAPDQVHESRALAVQPRTLEVARGLGIADELVRRGNPAVRLELHAGTRTVPVPLFDIGLDDTSYPFLLFLSQADTEAVLRDCLAASGVQVERGIELVAATETDGAVRCTLRDAKGGEEQLTTRFLVGCDGAHSRVRGLAGIGFTGDRYPQTFLLADLAADGLTPGRVHAFVTDAGPLLFFPLEQPAPWRVISMQPPGDPRAPDSAAPALDQLQRICDAATAGTVRLHDPVWLTTFALHHRHATRYRAGHSFLVGDAAHIHSPVGAQGMNTGMQDAWNLGWKLALVGRGRAETSLLDSYDAERRPVGAFVLRFTDRAFTAATSTNRLARVIRARVVPRVLPLGLRFTAGRSAAFRTVSQLGIRYRRSPLSEEGSSRLHRGPRAGDRLPDATVRRDGAAVRLHEVLAAPGFHLLLCGDAADCDPRQRAAIEERHGDLVRIDALRRRPEPGALHDPNGQALARLGCAAAAQLLVRPDGHVGYRCAGTDLHGVIGYLDRWLCGDDS